MDFVVLQIEVVLPMTFNVTVNKRYIYYLVFHYKTSAHLTPMNFLISTNPTK